MSTIKSFRGLIPDGGTQKISLSTRDGSIGYRIVKLNVITENPGDTAYEHVLKIFKVEPSGSPTSAINFGDNTLIATAFTKGDELTYRSAGTTDIVFDNEVFNEDIFITQVDTKGSLSCNYYIELEPMKLDLNENTMVTLKDIRNTNSQ